METVRVFTADRMQAIEDSAIVDGDVVGNNLILTRHDGATINAGNVRGPAGPTGASPLVVTSTTRPTTGLFAGLVIWESDTGQTFMYTGSDWMSYEPMRICTSSTHPSSPFEGMQIYEKDTHKWLIWNGVYFSKPWNMGWGGVAGAGVYGTYGTTETPLSYNPGPVTFTNPGHRNYRIKLNAGIYHGGNYGWQCLRIKRGGTTIRTLTPTNLQNPANDDRCTCVDEYNDQPPTGPVTYTVTGQCYMGTATVDVGTQNSILTVEDIGPWGNPI